MGDIRASNLSNDILDESWTAVTFWTAAALFALTPLFVGTGSISKSGVYAKRAAAVQVGCRSPRLPHSEFVKYILTQIWLGCIDPASQQPFLSAKAVATHASSFAVSRGGFLIDGESLD